PARVLLHVTEGLAAPEAPSPKRLSPYLPPRVRVGVGGPEPLVSSRRAQQRPHRSCSARVRRSKMTGLVWQRRRRPPLTQAPACRNLPAHEGHSNDEAKSQ